jgi:hypothetical protein
MNVRIALLVIGCLMAGCSSTARADAMKSVDPDQAPIAAVDRFSDKAANIQVRTPHNHLPGPNEPVDFDAGPFITQGLSPKTQPVIQAVDRRIELIVTSQRNKREHTRPGARQIWIFRQAARQDEVGLPTRIETFMCGAPTPRTAS